MLVSHQRKAGTQAKLQFKKGARAWRKRVLRSSQLGLVLAMLATLAGGYLAQGNAKVIFGVAAGAFGALWIALRDLVPPHIEAWKRGWEGERRTGRVLERLSRKYWAVIHDIELPDETAHIDHIVIGDAGIFLLDTKWYPGQAELLGGDLLLTYPDDPLEPARPRRLGPRMRAASADLRDRVFEISGTKVWVHAVVVLWTPFPQGVASYENVTYVHASRLVTWLRAQAPQEGFEPSHISAAIRRLAS